MSFKKICAFLAAKKPEPKVVFSDLENNQKFYIKGNKDVLFRKIHIPQSEYNAIILQDSTNHKNNGVISGFNASVEVVRYGKAKS